MRHCRRGRCRHGAASAARCTSAPRAGTGGRMAAAPGRTWAMIAGSCAPAPGRAAESARRPGRGPVRGSFAEAMSMASCWRAPSIPVQIPAAAPHRCTCRQVLSTATRESWRWATTPVRSMASIASSRRAPRRRIRSACMPAWTSAEVLAPWWTLFGVSLLVFGFYVAGFVYLLRSLRRAARRQARLQAELRAGDEELRLAHQVGGIGTSVDRPGRRAVAMVAADGRNVPVGAARPARG